MYSRKQYIVLMSDFFKMDFEELNELFYNNNDVSIIDNFDLDLKNDIMIK